MKISKRAIFERKMREYRRFLRNDHDWDYIYILELLKFKLARTRKCILKNNIIVSAPKVAQEILCVEQLLTRVLNDNYYKEITKNHRKKYGNLKITFGEKTKGGHRLANFKYTKTKSLEENDQAKQESSVLYRQAFQMKKQDLKRAFSLMTKNIWGWWD